MNQTLPTGDRQLTRAVRYMILHNPELLTQDQEIMTALGNHLVRNGDTADIRAAALEGLQSENKRLMARSEKVTTASYETAAATAQIHRAITHLSGAATHDELVARIETDLAAILKIPHARIEERAVRQLSLSGLKAELPVSKTHVLILVGDTPERFSQNLRKDLIHFFNQMLAFLWTTLKA